MDMQVNAEKDEPPEENREDYARQGLEKGEADVVVVPGDKDADEDVDQQDEASRPADRHGIAPFRKGRAPGGRAVLPAFNSLESGIVNKELSSERVRPITSTSINL